MQGIDCDCCGQLIGTPRQPTQPIFVTEDGENSVCRVCYLQTCGHLPTEADGGFDCRHFDFNHPKVRELRQLAEGDVFTYEETVYIAGKADHFHWEAEVVRVGFEQSVNGPHGFVDYTITKLLSTTNQVVSSWRMAQPEGRIHTGRHIGNQGA